MIVAGTYHADQKLWSYGDSELVMEDRSLFAAAVAVFSLYCYCRAAVFGCKRVEANSLAEVW
jgi:hypothetical protein